MKSLRETAMDYLARREQTRFELIYKLKNKGFEEADIIDAIDRLESDGLQSDRRFAMMFAEQRIRNGNGPSKIQVGLEKHGVSQSIIFDTFSEIEVDWHERAQVVWQRKYQAPPQDIKERASQQRFMLQRGFTHEQINNLLKAIA